MYFITTLCTSSWEQLQITRKRTNEPTIPFDNECHLYVINGDCIWKEQRKATRPTLKYCRGSLMAQTYIQINTEVVAQTENISFALVILVSRLESYYSQVKSCEDEGSQHAKT